MTPRLTEDAWKLEMLQALACSQRAMMRVTEAAAALPGAAARGADSSCGEAGTAGGNQPADLLLPPEAFPGGRRPGSAASGLLQTLAAYHFVLQRKIDLLLQPRRRRSKTAAKPWLNTRERVRSGTRAFVCPGAEEPGGNAEGAAAPASAG
ncbi:hypothetical protein [Paenibacillus chitinolyticus]|uniref:hypothetical protein n=1 Tax=Paenibacillus chitinolyticus TaxID=79263 RepID=UPI003556E3D6